MGLVYTQKIKGNKAKNIEQAIFSFQAALEIYTRNDFPQNNAETLFNLGLAYQNAQRFNEAYTTFEQTIKLLNIC